MDAFDQSRANFSGMTTSYHDFFIGEAIHQANIDVNEFGTEAAAATVLTMLRGFYAPNIPVFNCSRPFIYAIHDTIQYNILFLGKFTRPN
jgi:serpin B